MNLVEALHTVRSWRNWLREGEARPLPGLSGLYWTAMRQLSEAVDTLTPQLNGPALEAFLAAWRKLQTIHPERLHDYFEPKPHVEIPEPTEPFVEDDLLEYLHDMIEAAKHLQPTNEHVARLKAMVDQVRAFKRPDPRTFDYYHDNRSAEGFPKPRRSKSRVTR